uniref:Uncharacterized protein n=1 Tax=Oryza glumipatula TaxID=40148 RepID=A0A0E0ABW5_9ORYZ
MGWARGVDKVPATYPSTIYDVRTAIQSCIKPPTTQGAAPEILLRKGGSRWANICKYSQAS